MTRYEFFEAWLTPEEWKEWKIHSVKRFKQLHSLTTREARERRDSYLKIDVTHFTDRQKIQEDWDTMTNRFLRWSDTHQGHSYWSNVNCRTAPCRVLPPPRTIEITNTPN